MKFAAALLLFPLGRAGPGADAGIRARPQAGGRFLPRQLRRIAGLLPEAGAGHQQAEAGARGQDHARGATGTSPSSPRPRNLADLDKYKDTARRLALVKGLTDAQAHELAHNGKVIVHIDGGLHATEVAPRAACHPARLQPGDRHRPGDHRHSRQRHPAAVVLHQSRRPEHGGATGTAAIWARRTR